MRICCLLLLCGFVGHLRATEERELAATVLGEKIYLDQITPAEAATKRQELAEDDYHKWLLEYRANGLLSRVSVRVLNEFASRAKVRPSDQELDALFRDFGRKQLEDPKLDEPSKKKLALRLAWTLYSSKEWRTARALYEKYGGRVAISSFGACTSIDGRNAVLKEYAAAGDIRFHHAALEQAFWKKTRDPRVLDVTLQPDRVQDFFAVPPWEREFKSLAK